MRRHARRPFILSTGRLFQQLAKCHQLQPRRFKWERIRQELFVCKVRRAPPTTMHSISTAMASAETPIRRSIGRITVAGRMKPAMRDALKRCHTARENEIAAFGNWNAISGRRRLATATSPMPRTAQIRVSRARKRCTAEPPGPTRARAASARSGTADEPRIVMDAARRLDRDMEMFADRSKGRMSIAGRHGAVHDIAKKSVQLPIVHCRASE
jgi:hypothetical protein